MGLKWRILSKTVHNINMKFSLGAIQLLIKLYLKDCNFTKNEFFGGFL